ncbi:MAG TPA: adenosylcobinamide-phosphate synthase CbiB [Terriglobia bacterium]|nr:adenosylcobinamide-phosphate synthase CbiB [Terriglobia bacterium]
MLLAPCQWVLAFAADLLFGDPPGLPHPVRLLGFVITKMEWVCRKCAHGPKSLRIAGIVVTSAISFGVGLSTWALLRWIRRETAFAEFWVAIYLAYTTLSVRGLDAAGSEVLSHLANRQLDRARSALAMIVGRDTQSLDEPEIVRAVVETVAENTSDGVVAPMFYLAFGGVPAALTYKAINTLDSMIGYHSEEYLYLGWAAARLDDAVNFLPARLTAIMVAASASILRLPWKDALRIVRRDARSQPSPNSGYPEAAYAGALQIRLGGTNLYGGRIVRKGYLGDPIRKLEPKLFPEARRVLYTTSVLMLVASLGLDILIRRL